MKKYLVKLTMLLITLSFGIVVVWGFDLIPTSFVGKHETPQIKELKEKHKNEKVVVLFKGFSTENDEAFANFEVVNISDKPVRYWSFEEKGQLFHLVKFNDEELREFWCGTGQQEYELAPNDSIIMKKNAAYLFQNKYMEKGEFQINFSLIIKDNEFEDFWSESFTIPNDIKALIKAERGKVK